MVVLTKQTHLWSFANVFQLDLNWRQSRVVKFSVLLVLISAVLSCGTVSSSKPEANSPPAGSRYSIRQDRAPNREIDIASIPEVIPEPINRTGAGNRSPYTVLGKSYTVMPTEVGYKETGVASWYGEKFHGHKTSNGEIFDMYQASAAHKSLPIPSFLNVTNLDNNRSIVVRVNDRGPFHGDRIIDLSYAAAVKLGFADRGTARVQLDAITPSADRPRVTNSETIGRSNIPVSDGAYLQVGAFSDLNSARSLTSSLQVLTDKPVFIRSVNSDGKRLHRVRIGPLHNGAELSRIKDAIVAANLGSPYTVSQ